MEENHVITRSVGGKPLTEKQTGFCLTADGNSHAEKGGSRYIIYQEYDQETRLFQHKFPL